MGIYLIIPYLSKIVQLLDDKELNTLTLIYVIWMVISIINTKTSLTYSIGMVFSYFGYLLIGYSYKRINIHRNNRKGIFFIMIALLVLIINGIILYYYVVHFNGNWNNSWLSSNVAPLILIGSICLFKGFCYLRINARFSFLAQNCLIVYLIHLFVRDILINTKIKHLTNNLLINIICLSTIVFVISLLFSIVYNKIKNVLLSK